MDILSYILGLTAGKADAEGNVVIEGNITCTDDGDGNITITAEGSGE